jgi:hypothetical protein
MNLTQKVYNHVSYAKLKKRSFTIKTLKSDFELHGFDMYAYYTSITTVHSNHVLYHSKSLNSSHKILNITDQLNYMTYTLYAQRSIHTNIKGRRK